MVSPATSNVIAALGVLYVYKHTTGRSHAEMHHTSLVHGIRIRKLAVLTLAVDTNHWLSCTVSNDDASCKQLHVGIYVAYPEGILDILHSFMPPYTRCDPATPDRLNTASNPCSFHVTAVILIVIRPSEPFPSADWNLDGTAIP